MVLDMYFNILKIGLEFLKDLEKKLIKLYYWVSLILLELFYFNRSFGKISLGILKVYIEQISLIREENAP